MTENGTLPTRPLTDEVTYLSEIVGKKVYWGNKRLGKLADLVITEAGKVPEVTKLRVLRPFGDPALLLPWDKVTAIDEKRIVVELEALAPYELEPEPEAVLLKDCVMDKKVIDIEDREVAVVYDVRLVLRNQKLYVTDVDFSRYGLIRRLGLKGFADFIYNRAFMADAKKLLTGKNKTSPWDSFLNNLANTIKDKTLSWTYVQPLPTQISSFRGDVKLSILRDTLEEIPPVDLADILEELNPEQRLAILSKLDTELASDTLEEIDPNVQRDLVSSLKKERVAELIRDMTPGQAADILSILPSDQANMILQQLEPQDASKIESIFKRQEENILNFATTNVLKFPPDKSVAQVEEDYYRLAKEQDVIMYLYITDEQNKLLGVLDLKELLQASHDAVLGDLMVTSVVSLSPDSTLKEASALFARYGFRAIPVTDESDKLLGVVPYRDIMNLKHRFLE